VAMARGQMVLLRTVPSSFHARVLAARLGADGIPTHLRGAIDGPYPMGDVMVYVTDDDLSVAQELLLADEVEAAFAEDAAAADETSWSVRRIPPWLAVSLLFMVAMGCVLVVH